MRILLKFTLLSFMTGCLSSFIVPGYSGGTVIIYCHYNNQEERNGKYFCVRKTTLSCKDQIRSGSQNTWEHSGRFSLYDDTEENYFMVVIRQLTRQDEGIYWCGVDISVIPDRYTKVELEVKEDKCCDKSVTETVDLGGEDPIICNYPEKYENSIKYFCKEDNDSKIYYEIISAASTSAKSGRFSLTDNRREKRFTVTISNLTEYDTGTYWCGVENRRTEKLYISLITKVKLHVEMSNTTTKTTTAKTTTTPTTFSISSSSPSSSSSVNRSDTLGVVLLCVSLVVLLLVISLPVVSRWKANKRTAFPSAQRVSSDTGVNEESSHGEGYYEEIQERPQQSETGGTITTIYSTPYHPINPSDSQYYANVDFQRDPGNPSEATIAIIKDGTCPSEATTAMIKDGTCPSEATTAMIKDGTCSCDYANMFT